MLIKELIDEELTLPIKDILEFINSNLNTPSDSLENLTYIYDDKKIILMSVREGIDSLIAYAALIKKREEDIIKKKKEEEVLLIRNKIKTFLITSHRGLRANWNKSDEDICNEIEIDLNFKPEINNVKREIVKEWFGSINLKIPSDEQSDVIANLNNSLKVVARAGSGKTRTITQKVLFLIHFIGYSSDQIVSLTFNKKAQQELEKRLIDYQEESDICSRSDFKVLTFDSLAYNLVKPKQDVIEENRQENIITQLVLNALDNEENLRQQVEEIMMESFKDDWEKVLKLDKLSTQSDLDRLRSCLTEETMDCKSVKSRAEKRIADYLFEHDLLYSYEYPFTTDDGNIIRPDFFIRAPYKIIIEYCGLKGDIEYEESLVYKRKFWKILNNRIKKENNKYIVIEINPGIICNLGTNFDETRDIDYLKLTNLINDELLKVGRKLEIKRLCDQEILSRLRTQIRLKFVDLLKSAITRSGQIYCSDQELIDRFNNFQTDSTKEKTFLSLLPKFNAMYKDRLANNNLTDYSEIKKIAIDKILKGETSFAWDAGRQGIDLKKVKYVFVDEFQDFTELFRGLLLAILKVAPQALVNAVGDDWQMINRFAGSNPEYFDKFSEDYPKPKTVYLQTNYRSAGGIVDFCNLIMSNNGVSGKPSLPYHPNKNAQFSIFSINRDQIKVTPREEYNFKKDPVLSSIFRLFKPLTNEFVEAADEKDKLFFAISRTNNPPLKISPEDYKRMKAKNKRELIIELCSKTKLLSTFFDAVTAHKSKGLEANAVLVMQPKQFPMIHKRSVFLSFFGDTPENLLRDELNLFYVTCSRAKNHLCFLPESDYMMTPFIKKLKNTIKFFNWSKFPCTLKEPFDLHTITINSSKNDNGPLFKATDLLLANGFESFSRPLFIPTRSKKVRMSFLNTLLHLKKISEICSEFDLTYNIFDGINEKIYSWPGPQSIESKVEELTN